MQSVAVFVRINRDCPNSKFRGTSKHSNGNFRPIGNQQFLERLHSDFRRTSLQTRPAIQMNRPLSKTPYDSAVRQDTASQADIPPVATMIAGLTRGRQMLPVFSMNPKKFRFRWRWSAFSRIATAILTRNDRLRQGFAPAASGSSIRLLEDRPR